LDIYPIEIEESLSKHSNVIEAIAFGISVNQYEQEICAWVKLKDDKVRTTPEELIKFCLADPQLADYKVPKYIKIVQDFPTTNLGKYLRRAMEESYKKELGL
jgi:acyl-CoA synthetase (AMP-forming)/AMP-acid ligase II